MCKTFDLLGPLRGQLDDFMTWKTKLLLKGPWRGLGPGAAAPATPLSAVLVANPKVAASMNHMSLQKCFPLGRSVSLEDKMIIVDVADVMSHDLNTM